MLMKSQRHLDPRLTDDAMLTNALFHRYLSQNIYVLLLNYKLLKSHTMVFKYHTASRAKGMKRFLPVNLILTFLENIFWSLLTVLFKDLRCSEIKARHSEDTAPKLLQTNNYMGLTFSLLVVLDRMKEQATTGVVFLKIKYHPFWDNSANALLTQIFVCLQRFSERM